MNAYTSTYSEKVCTQATLEFLERRDMTVWFHINDFISLRRRGKIGGKFYCIFRDATNI